MIAQFPPSGWPPSAPHRTHWYVNEIGCVPVHVPVDAVRVAPCSARPLIAGSAVFDGAVACAAIPSPDGRTRAPSTSVVAATPLRDIGPSLVTIVMTLGSASCRELLRTSYTPLHRPYVVVYDARGASGVCS